jgi:hypothetical protein
MAGESAMRNEVVVTALARIVASAKRSSTRLQPLAEPPLFSDVPIHTFLDTNLTNTSRTHYLISMKSWRSYIGAESF